MASQIVLSTDETYFNGTIHGTQGVFETGKDEFVNSTVMSLSQENKRQRTKKSLAAEKPKAKITRSSNKENATPKNTGERKRGRPSAEAKREVLKALNGNSPKRIAAKGASSPSLKVEPPTCKSNRKQRKTSSTPTIVIYQDASAPKRSCRQKAERQLSKSCDGRSGGESKSEKEVACPRSKSARHSSKDVTTLTFPKNSPLEKSPSKGRGRLSKTDPEVQELLGKLETVFPNVDPDFLKANFWKFKGSLSGTLDYLIVKEKTNELPTKAEYLRRQEAERQQNEYLEKFSEENFLKMFPDPWEYFLKLGQQEAVKYKEHSFHYLKNKFKKHYTQAIQAALIKNHYSLYRTNKELQKKNRLVKMRATNRSKAECEGKRPATYNEQFMHEVAFIEKEAKIRAYIKKREAEKHKKFKQAKKAGTLLECLSCNDPSLLLNDAVNCPANHVFCKDCVVRSVDAAMNNNNLQFKCLVKCEEIFSMDSLQRALSCETIERIKSRKQLEEVKAAGIKDLVWCPFCSYATIMPPELSVLNCLNPDCMKESCRHCKQLNHIPLKCHELEEFEKSILKDQNEEGKEESPNQPLICIQCNKEYLETNETNKLVCPCGATICSICRQPIPKCPHFKDEPGKRRPNEHLSTSNDSDFTDTEDDVKDSSGSKIFDFDENLADCYPTSFHSF